MRPSSASLIWLLSLIVCGAAVILSFNYFDLAIASLHAHTEGPLNAVGDDLGSTVLLSGEAIILSVLTIVRLTCGKLPPFANALAVACLVSICAYGIDS